MRKGSKRTRAQKGEGIKEFFSGINDFLKKNKIISKAANLVGGVLPGPWGQAAGTVGSVAGALGYGKRRRAAPKRPKRMKGTGLIKV